VGTFGHVSAFSFCQDKIISTGGEGGMVVTNDQSIRDMLWSLRDHGRDRAAFLSNDHPPGFRWLQQQFGTNARMTEMQAAIGRCQLQKVDGWVTKRNQNASAIEEQLQQLDGVTALVVPEHMYHAYYRVALLVDDEQQRNRMVAALNECGILATIGPCPEIYREPAFVSANLTPPARLPIAEELGLRTISLPTFPGIENVIDRFSQLNCQDIP
jgi:dTDP-4-amino-4,6-dideoxygalactose transaminase